MSLHATEIMVLRNGGCMSALSPSIRRISRRALRRSCDRLAAAAAPLSVEVDDPVSPDLFV